MRDEEKIKRIESSFNLKDKKDINKIYSSIVTGTLRFESKVGFDFEDKIEELYKSRNLSAKDEKKKREKYEIRKKVEESEDIADKQLVEYYIAKNRKNKLFAKYIIIGICSIVVIACFVLISRIIGSELNNEESSKAIESAMKDNAFVFTTIEPVYNTKVSYDSYSVPDVLDMYLPLYEKNKDMIGFITIDDTHIDYPVVKGNDNEYYLSHGFEGKNDANGCIFADVNCTLIPRSKNIILYGHHMKSGKMFADLEKYNDYDFYTKHKEFTFDTIYETGKYEVVFVFRDYVHTSDDTDFKYYEFVNVNSETEFDSYMNELREKSLYDTGVEVNYSDELLSLSTCDYEQKNGRFVVMARKKRLMSEDRNE